MLTANAVKETLDALPDGVCFSEKWYVAFGK